MTYTSFLFDLDGTLINSNNHVIHCFQYAWQKNLGYTLPISVITATFGIPLEKAIFDLDPNNAEQLLTTYREESNRRGDQDITMIPGAKDVLLELKKLGLKTAIVTSKKRVNAYRSMDHFGLSPFIDVFVGPEDTKKHKPDPDPIQICLKKLHSNPRNALMIGDSPHDIAAGKAADCDTCGVLFSAAGPNAIRQANPTHTIDHLYDLLKLTP